MKLMYGHSTGQGLGHGSQCEHVGRSGEQKHTGSSITVHYQFDGSQQVWSTLHLVDGHRWIQSLHQTVGVCKSRIQGGSIIQGQVTGGPILFGQRLHERGFAYLTGADKQHYREGLERFQQEAVKMSLNHGYNLTTTWSNCQVKS